MARIQVLSDQTINQIAAGEVVENAASVVKELVENAVDAGATEVDVWIRAGGRQLIRVADNGSGMVRDDALLCLERHATSKIRSVDDLVGVASMGFRGEAIPSIASVSKMVITTAPEEGPGSQIVVEGGKILTCQEAARSRGTTVEVKALFYNVPVRKGFQKSVGHETGEVHRTCTQLALAHPLVRLRLYNQEQEMLKGIACPSASFSEALKQRVAELLGDNFARGMEAIEAEEGGVRLRGFVANPALSRPTRRGQYLFINGRPVVSREISEAMREAYGTRLPAGRHPVFVLHLDLSGDAVDVNVHPQKREVRLKAAGPIRILLEQTIMNAFSAPSEALAPRVVTAPTMARATMAREGVEVFDLPWQEQEVVKPEPVAVEAPLVELPLHLLGRLGDYLLFDIATLPESIKVGAEEGLLLVSRSAAEARILYETLLEPGKVQSQGLLVPLTVELLPDEAMALELQLSGLSEMGFEVRPFGKQTFAIEALPPTVDAADAKLLLQEVASAAEGAALERERLAKAAACAVASHRALMPSEAVALVRRLWQCKIIGQCPRGRPTYSIMAIDELEKKFK